MYVFKNIVTKRHPRWLGHVLHHPLQKLTHISLFHHAAMDIDIKSED